MCVCERDSERESVYVCVCVCVCVCDREKDEGWVGGRLLAEAGAPRGRSQLSWERPPTSLKPYRGTLLIRNSIPPQDHHQALGMSLL